MFMINEKVYNSSISLASNFLSDSKNARDMHLLFSSLGFIQ